MSPATIRKWWNIVLDALSVILAPAVIIVLWAGSNDIADVAWPMVALVGVVVLRTPLIKLIERVQTLEYKDGKASFAEPINFGLAEEEEEQEFSTPNDIAPSADAVERALGKFPGESNNLGTPRGLLFKYLKNASDRPDEWKGMSPKNYWLFDRGMQVLKLMGAEKLADVIEFRPRENQFDDGHEVKVQISELGERVLAKLQEES